MGFLFYVKNNIDSVSLTDSMSIPLKMFLNFCCTSSCLKNDIALHLQGIQQEELQITFLFLEKLEITLIKVINRSFESIVVCGDFNIDFLVESCEKEQFLNLINSFNLDITVKVPTRITVNSKKAIDQIIINKTTTRHELKQKI